MSMSVSPSSQDVMGLVNVALTRTVMAIAQNTNAQLLQSLPQAPGPSHLGQGIDAYL